MATSSASTVQEYLDELPPERREMVEVVRQVILEHLPEGYEEQMTFGMIGYVVPLERYPDTYNGQPLGIAAIASQRNAVSLYLHGVYADEDLAAWFTDAYRASGKRLDMGKSCVRFRRLDDLPLDLVAEVVARVPVEDYIVRYEASRRR
ncbi:MAG: DUF1801 domain-containing protein [Dehalococcoidia bacterium]